MNYSKHLRRSKPFFLILLITTLALAGYCLPANAASSAAPKVILNGKQLTFEVPPVIENGRTLVPVRTIFESMGAEVGWNAVSRTVTAHKGAIDVNMPINSTTPKVNGNVNKLDVAPKIVNSRTLAPLRFVGEAFGGRVSWDEESRTIYINNKSVEKPPAVKVNTYLVNVRSGPSMLTAIINHAHSGESFAVLDEQDGWFKINRSGQMVWVASWLVTTSDTVDPDPEPQPRVVVLDAGHGGYDPGALGGTLKEKNVNLQITLKVGEILKQNGITVVNTRSDDQFIDLLDRSSLANNLNASLFVAIHNNASYVSSLSGTETYFYAPASDPDLYAQRTERQNLAASIQSALVSQIQRKNLGVKEANFSVLRNTMMPSALVEVAFISNPGEESLLQSEDFINRAAAGIANGIMAYFN